MPLLLWGIKSNTFCNDGFAFAQVKENTWAMRNILYYRKWPELYGINITTLHYTKNSQACLQFLCDFFYYLLVWPPHSLFTFMYSHN